MDTPPRRWPGLLAARLPFYFGVPASLLAFPSVLPWVALFWIAADALLAFRGKPSWLPLVVAAAILLVKGFPWQFDLLLLPVALLIVAAIRLRPPPREARRGMLAYPTAALLASWVVFAVSWHGQARRSQPLALAGDRPVVVIGDSLSVHGWPRELAKQVSVPVVDLSEGGINTVEGLAKLPEALALKPQLVVIELGGHDYLEGRGRAATRENLERIIREVRGADAEVLLFEIPRGFVYDPFRSLERELGREHDLELVTDGAIRQLVLFSPFTPLASLTGRKLSDDGLHPNAAGRRFLAGRVKKSLVRLYGPAILAGGR